MRCKFYSNAHVKHFRTEVVSKTCGCLRSRSTDLCARCIYFRVEVIIRTDTENCASISTGSKITERHFSI